ncbi:MAG TPA: flagellar M-ring protein FliF C-terminal domain-containing protein [Candidatus Elarobacter sp.]|jgi:flagellar M-ring protein FliF|nr:flagellar M-ring protein FliF C-terminal domain-containing protein [Candidatus Elarobacter sp.]
MTLAAVLQRLRASSWRARAAALGACAVLIVLAVVGWSASRDTRVALFATPLRADQLAEVEQRLAAWNVPHASGADNVRVDRAKRGELLLKLALAGVPHAHLAGTDEALARVGALTPQTVLEAQTRDALAADLALGLRGIEGVADARVVIAPSSAGVYADEERRDASASVRVTLAPGARLAARTVAGIKAFVAGGVPGLDAERVTVLDDRGLALEGDGGDDGSDVQTALQSALDTAFGAGATIVRVHREPLGERRDLHAVHRTAAGGSVARTTSDERYASNAKKYSKTSATEDRGSDLREEHRVAAADATARLTVAVFVDDARKLDLAKIRALAAAAAGIRTDRGDVVSVEAVAFGERANLREARAPHASGWVLAAVSVLPQAFTALALVLVVAFGAKPLVAAAARAVESASARKAALDLPAIPADRVRSALDGEPPHVAAAIIASLPAATAAAVLELYPPAERAEIVRRLARANAALVPAPEELLRGR